MKYKQVFILGGFIIGAFLTACGNKKNNQTENPPTQPSATAAPTADSLAFVPVGNGLEGVGNLLECQNIEGRYKNCRLKGAKEEIVLKNKEISLGISCYEITYLFEQGTTNLPTLFTIKSGSVTGFQLSIQSGEQKGKICGDGDLTLSNKNDPEDFVQFDFGKNLNLEVKKIITSAQ